MTRFQTIKPLNKVQEAFLDNISKKPLTIAYGAAGTGKTLLAVSKGVQLLNNKDIRKIVVVRPAVTTEKLGFLPGDLNEKLDPYMAPIWDALELIIGVSSINKYREFGMIELASIAYMRGRTFSNAFVLLDEAQNTTVAQMKMFLTRFGEHSKVVITGDLAQSDIPGANGLQWILKVLQDSPHIGFSSFGSSDVVRSELSKYILEAIEKYEAVSQGTENNRI